MSLRSSISLQLAKSISTSSSSTSSTSLLPTVIQRSFSSKTSRNSPRSTSDLSDPTSTPQLTPLKTSNPKELANYFSKSLHPKIELPNNVALQAITHESWEMGNSLTGNNRRLSFIGRRALKFYLTLFLSSLISSSPSTSSILGSSFSKTTDQELEALESLLADQKSLDDLVHTTLVLGEKVGREWRLEEVMRWRAAMGDERTGGRESGLYKIRGVAVEGVLGAIYHQQGALIASNVFYSKILPTVFKESFPKSLRNSENLGKTVERKRRDGERELGLVGMEVESQVPQSQAQVKGIDVRDQVERAVEVVEEKTAEEVESESTRNQSTRVKHTRSSSNSNSTSSIPPHQPSEIRSADSTSL